MNIDKHTAVVKTIAKDLNFDFCGISKAEFLEEEAPKLETWLKRGYQGKMAYLENHFEKRLDPTKLVPGAKSVVSLVYNYYPATTYTDRPKIAKYAYGQDYHHVIKQKLHDFLDKLQEEIGEISGRVFVDSAPIHERAWAARSGLGWVGKNTLLLNREMGSFFFLAELVLDLELVPDGPMKDYCGTCSRCMDACPTEAIPEPYVVDGSKCISYLTIELKDAIPEAFKEKMEGWAFGCDICQDVCPWNRFSKPHKEAAFQPQGWEQLGARAWKELTEETFRKVFKKSPVKRTKYGGLKRNLDFLHQ